jgi:thiol:disulfide interchange protein DsbD
MKGDWTNEDAEVTEALRQFGRDGVPLYVLYSGNSSDAPMILPQVLTKSIVLNAAKKMITNGNKDQKRKY